MDSERSLDPRFRVVRKRNRVPLSCAPCRNRKLKCDRSSPCQNCVKRGEATSCVYAVPSGRKRSSHAQPNTAISSPDSMQDRIDRLEGLVLSLMTNGDQSAGPNKASRAVLSVRQPSAGGSLQADREIKETQMLDDGSGEEIGDDSDTERVTQSFGIMKVDNEKKKTSYYGEGHWAAILNDIIEVRNFFQAHKHKFDEKCTQIRQSNIHMEVNEGPALLFGTSKPPPRAEILSQLPSKYLTDILIARYFDILDPATHIIHVPVFRKQYDAHWAGPSGTSIVWVAMLFAILRVALLSYIHDSDEPPEFAGKSLELSNTFRTAMTNCLILADYTKPHQHLVETLIFHLHAEYCSRQESEAGVWVLVGMIVRLAMRMGYHRDSKMFPNISPFEGEMRRRVWAFLRQADILFSFQASLPGMIRIGDSDTELPRNIYDEEFDEDTTALPPSRPTSDPTTVSHLITKARLAFGFGRVLEEVNNLCSKPYEERLKVDHGLRKVFEAVPDHLKPRSTDEQSHLPITEIVASFRLATIYHGSQCVLHRIFLYVGRNHPGYAYSRRACLQSAMALVAFQSTLRRETRETGRLWNKRSWFTSLTAHNFLLAATIIAMALYQEKRRTEASAASTAPSPCPPLCDSNSSGSGGIGESHDFTSESDYTQEDMLQALEESKEFFAELSDVTMEAFKASEILKMLIAHLISSHGQSQRGNGVKTYGNGHQGGARGLVDEKQNAAMTLGLLSSGGKSPDGSVPTQSPVGQQGAGSLYDSSNSIDDLLQPGAPKAVINGGFFDLQSPTNGPIPFLGMFGAGAAEWEGMNLDWQDAFDPYNQTSHLGLDPANTLWSSMLPNPDPLPTASTSAANASSNTAPEIPSSLYSSPPKTTAFNNRVESGLSSSNATQSYGNIPLDRSMQRPQVSADEVSRPRQDLMGMPTMQSDNVPAWKWDNNTAGQGQQYQRYDTGN